FAVFDRHGDIHPIGLGQQGIFCEDTRHISRLELRISGRRPLFLSSSIHADNILLSADLTNPDIDLPSGELLPHGMLHLNRHKFLDDYSCFERISAINYAQRPLDVELSFSFAADFADIFEVRGEKRRRRGTMLPEEVEGSCVTLVYEGLDHVIRRTRITSSMAPSAITPSQITLPLHLDPQQEVTFSIDIVCECNGQDREVVKYDGALQRVNQQRRSSPLSEFSIYTSNRQFNHWANRSMTDLQMMLASTPLGLYPYAGVPWFR